MSLQFPFVVEKIINVEMSGSALVISFLAEPRSKVFLSPFCSWINKTLQLHFYHSMSVYWSRSSPELGGLGNQSLRPWKINKWIIACYHYCKWNKCLTWGGGGRSNIVPVMTITKTSKTKNGQSFRLLLKTFSRSCHELLGKIIQMYYFWAKMSPCLFV